MVQKRYPAKVLDEYALVKLVVPHYDTIRQRVGTEIKNRYRDSKQESISVLEIGSGSGYTTLALLLADQRIKVHAVDIEPVIIAQARINLGDYIKMRRVELIEADAFTYLQSLEPESFDASISTFAIHNFNQKDRSHMLRNLHRVLKPKGVFVNGDKYANDDEQEHELELRSRLQRFRKIFENIDRPDLKEEWIKHCLVDNLPDVIMKEGKSIEELREIGFSEVEKIYRRYQEAIIVASK
jgi:tRNA (cmo5U34)-methyltransferase